MDIRDNNVLIWDVDGVLIYVRESYRKTIVETVQYYFSELIGLEFGEHLMTIADTQKFKLVEGFNDDWRVTYACVLCFLAKLVSGLDKDALTAQMNGDVQGLEGKLKRLKVLGTLAKDADLKLDLARVTGRIREEGSGLPAAEKALSKMFSSVPLAKEFWFTDIVKRVFQEMYLGEALFAEKYDYEPMFVKSSGFMRNEKAIVSLETLERLNAKFYMGIASGRERFEIEASLKEHGFSRFIPLDMIVSAEGVVHGKPDPESLLKCKKKIVRKYGLEAKKSHAVYVGDSIDDVRAAKNAGFYSVGCLSASTNKEDKANLRARFVELGCDLIVEDANELSSRMG